MARIKYGDGSEGDEMDDSDSFNSSSDGSISSDGSESDDSEMDDEELEKRRNFCLETLESLEQQFLSFRDQLYQEKINEAKSKLADIQSGVAEEYTKPLQELENNMRTRIEVAGILRKMRIENIEKCYRAEEQAAKQNFENERNMLFEKIKENLEEKMRKCEEERNLTLDDVQKIKEKKSEILHRPGPSRRRPATVSGPYIVYMLSDADIQEDWTIVKKALSSVKSTDLRL